MSIGTLFLITILVVIGVWLYRTLRRARKLYRMIFFGEMPGNDSRTQSRNTRQQEQKKNNPKSKLFTADDGEYIEFEEIKTTSTRTSTHTGQYTTEEQVEDVEWEEIKS